MKIRKGLEIDDDALADICRRYHLAGLWLFGSSARGDFTTDSDKTCCTSSRPARTSDGQSST